MVLRNKDIIDYINNIDECKFPHPFDDDVASLFIRGYSNDPKDYISIRLAANFLPGRINFELGGSIYGCHMEICRANITIDYINSNIISSNEEIITDNNGISKTTISSREESGRGSQREFGLDAKLSLDMSSIDTKGTVASAANIKSSRNKYYESEHILENFDSSFNLINNNKINILNFYDAYSPLNGKYSDSRVSIKIKPRKNNETYGIISRLLVKDCWVNVRNFESNGNDRESKTGLFSFLGRNESDRSKLLFNKLISYLIMRKLQGSNEKDFACLDISGVLYRNGTDLVCHSFHNTGNKSIVEIDYNIVEAYINGDDDTRKNIIANTVAINNPSILKSDFNTPISSIDSNNVSYNINCNIKNLNKTLPSWSDLYIIACGELDRSDWVNFLNSKIVDKFEFEFGEMFSYLISVSRYSLIPSDVWFNINLYMRYGNSNLDIKKSLHSNGMRFASSNRLELGESSDFNMIYYSSDDDRVPKGLSGAWLSLSMGLRSEEYGESDNLMYKYAHSLDLCTDLLKDIDIKSAKNDIFNFLKCSKISSDEKILAIVFICQSSLYDYIFNDIMIDIDPKLYPGVQIGIINSIESRGGYFDQIIKKRLEDSIFEKLMMFLEHLPAFSESNQDELRKSFIRGISDVRKR